MNLKKRFSPKQQEERFYFEEPALKNEMSNTLLKWLPKTSQELVFVCIGTDRSTGDSLGPLTGNLLKEQRLKNFSVYGTLDSPVHAVNLEETLKEIKIFHYRPFIIAIDACLGKTKSIGAIITAKGPVKPGAALKKELPEVGNIHITGVVNVAGYMEYLVLQNTRLHTVMQMAKKITEVVHHLDTRLTAYQSPLYYRPSMPNEQKPI